MPHPVRAMGFLIDRGERVLRRLLPGREGLAGTVLVVLTAGLSFALPAGLLLLAYRFSPWAGFVLELWLCYQALSARCLQQEAMKVYDRVIRGDLPEARKAVSMIVGRDPERLDMEGVIKAAVETVAENLSDGVIAPLVFMALGGPALGMFYKGVNTMDSMIGYTSERYLRFGRTAAKLDDAANRLPARLSGVLLIAAAALTGLDAANARRIYRRDRYRHASPNSGHGEAACAGALGVALAGDAYYGGELCRKPSIGDALRPVRAADIPAAVRLMYVSAALCLPAACLVRLAVRGILMGMF
ncbi:MAG: adenosylcobinamide-phosphate synthase CbiB [Spirochaetaceae bacterium]|nr:adenosylcobinamide-phosphate synthase CbiB [Spirochaetaceae bacterium]